MKLFTHESTQKGSLQKARLFELRWIKCFECEHRERDSVGLGRITSHLLHDLRANAFRVCREGKPVPTPLSKCGAGFLPIMLLLRRNNRPIMPRCEPLPSHSSIRANLGKRGFPNARRRP